MPKTVSPLASQSSVKGKANIEYFLGHTLVHFGFVVLANCCVIGSAHTALGRKEMYGITQSTCPLKVSYTLLLVLQFISYTLPLAAHVFLFARWLGVSCLPNTRHPLEHATDRLTARPPARCMTDRGLIVYLIIGRVARYISLLSACRMEIRFVKVDKCNVCHISNATLSYFSTIAVQC